MPHHRWRHGQGTRTSSPMYHRLLIYVPAPCGRVYTRQSFALLTPYIRCDLLPPYNTAIVSATAPLRTGLRQRPRMPETRHLQKPRGCIHLHLRRCARPALNLTRRCRQHFYRRSGCELHLCWCSAAHDIPCLLKAHRESAVSAIAADSEIAGRATAAATAARGLDRKRGGFCALFWAIAHICNKRRNLRFTSFWRLRLIYRK
jgi:hypothetical protein